MFSNSSKARNEKLKNPLNELPFPITKIIKDIDVVILSHTHGDHWDDIAAKHIPKSTLIFVNNNSDKNLLKAKNLLMLE